MASDASANLNDDLHLSLAAARTRLAVVSRADELREQLDRDLASFEKAVRNGEACFPSPLEKIKIEALAHVYLLAGYHCACARQRTRQGNHDAAHHWAVDEGLLKAAFNLVLDIELPTPADD